MTVASHIPCMHQHMFLPTHDMPGLDHHHHSNFGLSETSFMAGPAVLRHLQMAWLWQLHLAPLTSAGTLWTHRVSTPLETHIIVCFTYAGLCNTFVMEMCCEMWWCLIDNQTVETTTLNNNSIARHHPIVYRSCALMQVVWQNSLSSHLRHRFQQISLTMRNPRCLACKMLFCPSSAYHNWAIRCVVWFCLQTFLNECLYVYHCNWKADGMPHAHAQINLTDVYYFTMTS